MSTLIHKRVEAARQGANPTVICRMRSGWLVIGDTQFLRGYSLLLPDPVVKDLNALSTQARGLFLQDMTIAGDALLKVTRAVRINYEILGNSEPALHVHLFPRYDTEPAEFRQRPVWFYDRSNQPSFEAERDRELMAQIAAAIADFQGGVAQ